MRVSEMRERSLGVWRWLASRKQQGQGAGGRAPTLPHVRTTAHGGSRAPCPLPPLFRGSGLGPRWLWLMLLLSGAVMAEPSTRPAVISGEIHAVDAQPILTPPSDSSPVVLRSFVAEGQPVRKGDVVLSIDGGQAASNTRQFKSERLQAAARADKEVAALEVAAIDAERKLRISEATLDKARIDAAIPREHLAALDFDRYRGALQQAERELEVARNEWTAAVSAVNRRREDRQIELAQFDEKIAYWEAQAHASEVRAERDGVVVHGFDKWRGSRFDEGSSSYPGQRVGDVIGAGQTRLGVRAYALEVDRRAFSVGDPVQLYFDSAPGRVQSAQISRIAGAPQAKAEWGEGRYFQIDIELPENFDLPLRSGSSVRVVKGETSPTPVAFELAATRRFEGEIVALESSAISPPAIENLWQLTLTQLVPDGSVVTEGQVVAEFDGSDLMRQLAEKQGSLNEKRSQLERLRLELAERERTERIATAEQAAALEKARRKASQPATLLSAMAYRKLAIERVQAEAEMDIVTRREVLAARQRQAEREELEAGVDLLEQEVATLSEGLGALSIKAPRAGVMLHLSNWQGEKFDVGSSVFRGMAVAQIPDLSRLAVSMQVPERQIERVQIGQRVQVSVEGGAVSALSGTVSEIGRVVRSRSRANPIPVVDVRIDLDRIPEGAKLKPGLPVRVDLEAKPT